MFLQAIIIGLVADLVQCYYDVFYLEWGLTREG